MHRWHLLARQPEAKFRTRLHAPQWPSNEGEFFGWQAAEYELRANMTDAAAVIQAIRRIGVGTSLYKKRAHTRMPLPGSQVQSSRSPAQATCERRNRVRDGGLLSVLGADACAGFYEELAHIGVALESSVLQRCSFAKSAAE
jgi:hypothetical protein